MSALMNRLVESLSESMPTRFLCLTPSRKDLPRHVLEITRISAGSPFCYRTDSQVPIALPFDISFLLFLNKESMLIDPIDWDMFVSRITVWAKSGQSIIIPQPTDALFKERSSLAHCPRVLQNIGNSTVVNPYTFANLRTPPEPNLAKSINIPFPMADLIDRTHKHPQTRFKISRKDDFEVAPADLSFTLFFYGFEICENDNGYRLIFGIMRVLQTRSSIPNI